MVGSPREVKSATGGKAELALPTLAIAEVPVAELPVRDRLLLWENSQLVKFRVEHEAILKSKDRNEDTAQPEVTDPCAGGVHLRIDASSIRTVGYAHISCDFVYRVYSSLIGRAAFAVLQSRELLAHLLHMYMW